MPNDSFIQFLVGLARREDRAALAKLRRGLGKKPGEAPESFPLVVRWIRSNASDTEEKAYYLVASLFALHPCHTDVVESMGETFQQMARAAPDGAGMERRFVAMLNARGEDLSEHLRHAVALARSKDVPINYGRLLRDIMHWDYESRQVQRDWARDFWSQSHEQEPGNEQYSPAVAGASSPTEEN